MGNFLLVLGVVGLVAYKACAAVTQRFGEVETLNFGLAVLAVGFSFLVDVFEIAGVLSPTRMWIGMILLWSIGSSLAQIVIISLFSKHLQINQSTKMFQGIWMGWITAFGSIGRIVFPFLTGWLYSSIGRGGVFLFVAIVHVMLFVAAVRMSNRMKPAPAPASASIKS